MRHGVCRSCWLAACVVPEGQNSCLGAPCPVLFVHQMGVFSVAVTATCFGFSVPVGRVVCFHALPLDKSVCLLCYCSLSTSACCWLFQPGD